MIKLAAISYCFERFSYSFKVDYTLRPYRQEAREWMSSDAAFANVVEPSLVHEKARRGIPRKCFSLRTMMMN